MKAVQDMITLIKLHQKYLLNKHNYLICGLICIIVSLGMIIAIFPWYTRHMQWLHRTFIIEQYRMSSYLLIKVLLVLLSSYWIGNSFTTHTMEYHVLLCNKDISKWKICFSNCMMLNRLLFQILVFFFIIYAINGLVFSPWFYVSKMDVSFFLNIYLVSSVYGYLAMNLVLWFKHYLAVVMPVVLFLVSEMMLTQNSNQALYFQILFPNVLYENNQVLHPFSTVHLFILSTIYFLIGQFHYDKSQS